MRRTRGKARSMGPDALTRRVLAHGFARHVFVVALGISLASVLAVSVVPTVAKAEEDNQQGAVAQVAVVPASVGEELRQSTATTSQGPTQSAEIPSASEETPVSPSGSGKAATDVAQGADAVTNPQAGMLPMPRRVPRPPPATRRPPRCPRIYPFQGRTSFPRAPMPSCPGTAATWRST